MNAVLRRILPLKDSPAPTARDSLLLDIQSPTDSHSDSQRHTQGRLFSSTIGSVVLWLMVTLYIITMLRLVFHLYDTMGFQAGWDLAIFDQATWLISHGQPPFVTIRGLHILSDHFSVILYLLAPLYWFWDSPKVLLSVQTVALALGALPVYALARVRLGSIGWGLTFAAAYLLNPVLQWANSYEFHPDTLAVPLLLAAFLFLWRRQWRLYFLCLLGAALTKENVGLTVCALGIWVWWRVDRRIGWLTGGTGLFFIIVALSTVRYFNHGTPSGYYLLYEKYGTNLPTLAFSLLRRPDMVWADVSSLEGRTYLLHLLQPVMFLPLLTPSLLWAALPSLLTNLLSSRGIMHTLEGGYYSALLIPVLFVAAIESCHRWSQLLGTYGQIIVGANFLMWAVTGSLQGALWEQNRQVINVSVSQIQVIKERRRAVAQALQYIPPHASISAQISLIPYLSHRQHLYTFPNPFLERGWGNTLKARRELEFFGGFKHRPPQLQAKINAASVEYVALCPATMTFPLPNSNFKECALSVFKSPSYGIIYMDHDVVLLRRYANCQAGWRPLSSVSGVPVHQAHDIETAFWRWLAQQPASS